MKLGKITDGNLLLVDVESGIEVGGTRTEKELLDEGYKPFCGEGIEGARYIEYPSCIVEECVADTMDGEGDADSTIQEDEQ